MLIISQNLLTMYDTSSGKSIYIKETNLQGEFGIYGADGCVLGLYDSKEKAQGVLDQLWKNRSDVIRMKER